MDEFPQSHEYTTPTKILQMHDRSGSADSPRDDVQNYSVKYVTEARKLRLIPA